MLKIFALINIVLLFLAVTIFFWYQSREESFTNLSTNSNPPMGASSSNREVLYNIKATLAKNTNISQIQKKMLQGEIYFDERRFIEASHLLSQILDENHQYPKARNLLARCFFFLGNPDRAVAELEYVIVNQQNDHSEIANALFIMGAIIHDNPHKNVATTKKGIAAWQTYLKLHSSSSHKQRILSGLKEMEQLVNNNAAAISVDSNKKYDLIKAAHNAFKSGDFALSETLLKSIKGKIKAETLTLLGRIYLQTSRSQKAKKAFLQAITIEPQFMPGWHYRGMAFIMAADAQMAVKCWQHIVKNDSHYAQKHNLHQRIAVAKAMLNSQTNKSTLSHN